MRERIFQPESPHGFLIVDKRLMQLLTRPFPHYLYRNVFPTHCLGHIQHCHGSSQWDKDGTWVLPSHGQNNQIYGLPHAHPEPGHVGIGKTDFTVLCQLLKEKRDHRASAAHHIPIPHAAENSTLREPLGCLREHSFHDHLSAAVDVHCLHCLVSGHSHHSFDSSFLGRSDYYSRAHCIHRHALRSIHLCINDIFHCSAMYHSIVSGQGRAKAI